MDVARFATAGAKLSVADSIAALDIIAVIGCVVAGAKVLVTDAVVSFSIAAFDVTAFVG